MHGQDFAWPALETTVTTLDGDEAPEHNLRLFRLMQGRAAGPLSWFDGELAEEEFLQTMRDECRLICQFEIAHSYGMR